MVQPLSLSSLVGRKSNGRQSPLAINLLTASLNAILAAVIEAHRVPPSAFRTSQSTVRAIGPNASRSIAPLRERAINLSISCVRPLAPLLSLLNLNECLRGRNVIFFIDNAAAAYILVRGSCREKDLQVLVTLFHVFARKMGVAWWIEWIPSKANASDGLSRMGDSKWVVNPRSLSFPKWLWQGLSLELLRKAIDNKL